MKTPKSIYIKLIDLDLTLLLDLNLQKIYKNISQNIRIAEEWIV